MLFKYRVMKRSILSLLLAIVYSIHFGKAQSNEKDSLSAELKKIKANNAVLKLKDSIRAELVRERFYNLTDPKTAEIEKYQKQLAAIRLKDSLRLDEEKKAISLIRNKVKPIPVQPFYRPLFYVYSDLGPFSAQQRAEIAQQNILTISDKSIFSADSLTIERKPNYSNILYSGKVITNVSEEDALWGNITRDSMTMNYARLIKEGIINNRERSTIDNVIHRWMLTAGIIVAFLVCCYLLRRLLKWIVKRLLSRRKIREEGLRIRRYQFMTPGKFRLLAVRLLELGHTILLLLLTYLTLSLIFSIFPATTDWAERLLNWVWTPLKDIGLAFYHYLPNLLRIMIVLLVGRSVARILRYFSIEIRRGNLHLKGFHQEWAAPTYQLIRLCLFSLTIIIIFPMLPGSDSNAFKGISVFFGILISLGSSSAISNTIAGIIITYMQPFKEGDWIRVNDVTGEVIRKAGLMTKLRTISNEEVTVPNSMILTNRTTNYSSSAPDRKLMLSVSVNVSFHVSVEIVDQLLMKAAFATSDIAKEPLPFVFKNKIDETYIIYQLNAYTSKPQNMFTILSDLNDNVIKTFKASNVELLSPRYYPRPKN